MKFGTSIEEAATMLYMKKEKLAEERAMIITRAISQIILAKREHEVTVFTTDFGCSPF